MEPLSLSLSLSLSFSLPKNSIRSTHTQAPRGQTQPFTEEVDWSLSFFHPGSNNERREKRVTEDGVNHWNVDGCHRGYGSSARGIMRIPAKHGRDTMTIIEKISSVRNIILFYRLNGSIGIETWDTDSWRVVSLASFALENSRTRASLAQCHGTPGIRIVRTHLGKSFLARFHAARIGVSFAIVDGRTWFFVIF